MITAIHGKDQEKWMIRLRREFHQYPELAFQERRTTSRVVEILKGFDLTVRTFEPMTGAVAQVQGKRPGPCIAFRADMDALPLKEATGLPYASKLQDQMHACGHDLHTAILLGLARRLHEEDFAGRGRGRVIFVFQPAEEQVSGAKAMLERGALDGISIDSIFALHVAPSLPTGTIGVFREVAFAASDRLQAVFRGRGGHGAQPESTRDPVLAAASWIVLLQSVVSRCVSPADSAVVSVCRIRGGTAANIIPEEVFVEGTVRTLASETRVVVLERLEALARGSAEAHGVEMHLDFSDPVPPLRCDERAVGLAAEAARTVVGEEGVQVLKPLMVTEDFAFFAERYKGAIVLLGCGDPDAPGASSIHSATFVADESCMGVGLAFFRQLVKRCLGF